MVLPLALLMVLAIVQVGLVAKDALVVAQAAREGAREAAVTTEEARVREAVLRSGLEEVRTEISIERDGGAGDPVTVEVGYRPPLLVPFVGWLFRDEVVLSESATMRQEAPSEGG